MNTLIVWDHGCPFKICCQKYCEQKKWKHVRSKAGLPEESRVHTNYWKNFLLKGALIKWYNDLPGWFFRVIYIELTNKKKRVWHFKRRGLTFLKLTPGQLNIGKWFKWQSFLKNIWDSTFILSIIGWQIASYWARNEELKFGQINCVVCLSSLH